LDLVQRAKAMILTPAAEWRTIERESGDPGYLFVNYVACLAAIPPICQFLRWHVFGWRHMRFYHHAGLFGGLFGALAHWLAAFVVVYAMALIVDALAPTFSGQKNRESAMKLVAYAMTPAWLGGVFVLIPGLGFLRFLALLYAVYVFWLGLPILMKSPSDRTGPYALAAILCGIVLFAVVVAIVGPAA
jgi:hypothetical protein